MLRVVVVVRIEAAQPQIRAHRDTRLERQHCQLRLLAQRTVVVIWPRLPSLKFILGRNLIRVRLQSLGGERRAVDVQVTLIGRQRIRCRRQMLRGGRPIRLQGLPIRTTDYPFFQIPDLAPRVGNGAQQVGPVDPSKSRHAGGLGVPPKLR